MSYSWNDLVESIRPYADRPVGTVRIDTDDIRLILARNDERLKLVAALDELVTRIGPRWFLEQNWAEPIAVLAEVRSE